MDMIKYSRRAVVSVDIGLYGPRRHAEIYRGLIWGYTATLAAFGAEKSLDKVSGDA
jgi:hypothetical protein